MTEEFTGACNHYYRLKQAYMKRLERLNLLVNNAPNYGGQTNLCEMDAIISYYRDIQAAQNKVDEKWRELKETGQDIIYWMKHFNIETYTLLTGQIPGELEYELCADEDDYIFIRKTRDLEAAPHNPNIITVKLSGDNKGDEDDF